MSIVERFERSVRDAPHEPVAWTAGGMRDRAALNEVAGEIGRALAPAPPGCRIALSARDPFAFLGALLAIWRHGGAAVLLDANDPRAPRLDQARELGAAACLTVAGAAACRVLSDGVPAGADAVVKLTSGSTGVARGIAVGFEQLVADTTALERAMGIGDVDRVAAAVPLSFSYGLGSVAVPALLCGRRVVLPEPGDPLALRRALRDGEPTVLPAVPALVRALLAGEAALPSSLRLVISAGARLCDRVAARFRRRFGRAVHAFYGASECGGIAFDPTGTAAERGTVGPPVPGVAVAITPAGRVAVTSPAVARATIPDDGSVRDGTYTTPDLGELRGGELVLLGRCDELIDVGGFKVQPREIERVIAELDGVDDVAVAPWSPAGGRAGCAALIAGRGVDEATVRRHCVAALAAHKVPRRILVVPELPRTARGKLRREDVDRLLAGGGAEQPSQ